VSKAQINRTIIAVAEKIRNDESVELLDAIVTPYGDLEHYLRQCFDAQLRRDSEAVKKNFRDAQRQGLGLQLALPGMDHASLPACVWVRNPETGLDDPKSTVHATLLEIKAEVRKQRRSVDVQDRVVSGWEATIARAEELGATDDWTGAELEAAFPKEME
jgi:hypothetical protein